MSKEQKLPTIENPFASPARTFKNKSTAQPTKQRGVAKPIMKQSAPQPVLEAKQEPEDYNPGFYVSRASRRFVTQQVEAGKIDSSELPLIYEFAMFVSNIFNRPMPSLSDVEVGVQLRNLETVQEIVAGTKTLDILRKEAVSMEIMPKNERIKLWKRVSEIVLQRYNEKRNITDDQPN